MNDPQPRLPLQSGAELSALLDAIDRVQGVVRLDLCGNIVSANANFLSWLGYTADELVGKPHALVCPADYTRSEAYKAFWDKLRSGDFHRGEFPRVAKGGAMVWINASYNPVFDQDGKVAGVVKFATNITAEKLRNADFEAKMHALELSQAVVEFDLNGRVLHANENFLRMFNYSHDQVLGRHHLMFCEESYVRSPAYAEFWRGLAEGRFRSGQFKRIDSLGREVWLQATYNPVFDADGRAVKIVKFASDITGQKRRNAEFEGVVSAIKRSVAVIEFDLKGRVLDISPKMGLILEYAPEELIGEHHTRLLDPEFFDQEKYTAFWAALRRGEPLRDEVVRVSRTGRRIHMEASYTPVADPEGRIYKVIKFAIDLTERHALNEALRQAVRKAEAATEAKSMFLANMSHEIRTPMNSIIGFADLLAQESLTKKQSHYTDVIGTSARSLLRLLNDILDASKLEQAGIQFEQIDFSLHAVCEHCIDAMGVLANRKGIALEFSYQPDMSPYFSGDPERIRQILVNLISNAVKFTERGGVTVDISSDAAGHVVMAVRDTGIGIPADRLEKIFEPFSQADGSITRRYGGTGLGTTIVRQLVSLMGGRVEVQSTVDVGSEFRVTLPLKPGKKPAEIKLRDIDDVRPLRILAVDDSPHNIELLVNVLGRHGHQLTAAENGKVALDLYSSQPFDLILMDCHMPVMDGMQAAREIRRVENQRRADRVPMIALTASVEAERRHLAIEAGMDSFVMKPLDVAILKAEIARLTSGKVVAVGPVTGNPAPESSVERMEPVDWVSGVARWGGEEVLVRAIRAFANETRTSLSALQAETTPDASRIKQIMHRFKGAAGNLSLLRVAAVAKAAEAAAPTMDAEAYAATLADVAAEVESAAAMLEVRQSAVTRAHAPASDVGAEAFADLVERVAASFRHFEIDEALLVELSMAAGTTAFEPVQRAVDSFDFEAGLRALETLKRTMTA
ncbi:MAG: PAS domain S-box protein [Rhodocyclaceae bacterium]|nr:PAS domain S-box protein [Rhodocyclaceae bacterium]